MDIKTFVPKVNIGSVLLDDAELLRGLIKALNPHYVVEIGTFVGTSILVMADALRELQNTSKLYTVDRNDHGVMEKAKEKGLDEYIEFSCQDSYEFSEEIIKKLPFIDFVFYDGEAHIDQYKRHFELLKTKMKPGSIYAVHDCYTREHHHKLFLKQLKEKHITIPTKKGLTLIQI